jgi:hypothetical protein
VIRPGGGLDSLIVATQLADSPPEEGRSETAPGAGAPAAPPQAPSEPGAGCAKCGARMAPGQDWCLQCGAGAPGSVGRGGWRPLASVLAATAVLVLGAAAAGYAALSKKTRHAAVVTTTVAQVTPTPPAPTPTTSTPLPGITTKPPKIPLKAATPPPATTTPAVTPVTPTNTGTGKQNNSSTGGSKSEETQPEAILLDTNAASTYNPYNYPAAWFGDPSSTIDGDTTTGWTAQVNPTTAPNLAEGLLLDLKSLRKLSAVKLVTSTPGITVQVYGTAAKAVPASITDPAWVPLSRSITVKKRHARLALRNRKKSYRFVTVWLSKAPASALGTPEAPGKIILDEVELLPAA